VQTSQLSIKSNGGLMVWRIVKIYHDGKEARAQDFDSKTDAVDYLDLMSLKAKQSGEFFDEASDTLVVKRDGTQFCYEIREVKL
jgi:hypothetical protein